MPLSEQEQRLLEEMERSLYHNDADYVATVSGRGGKRNYTTIVVGILVGTGLGALAHYTADNVGHPAGVFRDLRPGDCDLTDLSDRRPAWLPYSQS